MKNGNSIPAIISLFFLVISCNPKQFPGWNAVEKNAALQHPFFNAAHTKYPWFMIKNDDGSWSSGLADSLGNELLDTTLIPVYAQVIVNNDSIFNLDELHWKQRSEKDTLHIALECFNAAYSGQLNIAVFRNSYRMQFSRHFVFPTENSTWRTLEQQLILNDKKPGSGEARGYVRYVCEQTVTQYSLEADKPRKLETWKDTVRMEGVFRIPVTTR